VLPGHPPPDDGTGGIATEWGCSAIILDDQDSSRNVQR